MSWKQAHKQWGKQKSKTAKREFAKAMNDIDLFCQENGICQSSTSDSYYFTINGQNYRVSNHSVNSSPYHNGKDKSTIYIHASKLRIKDIYNALESGYKLNGKGEKIQ